MKVPAAWPALLLALSAGCYSPVLIGGEGSSAHIVVQPWVRQQDSDDSPLSELTGLGMGVFTTEPRTGGWGWEIEGRYGTGEEDTAGGSRESELYELSIGVRQTYRVESGLRPYIGLGPLWTMTNNHDPSVGGAPARSFDEEGFGAYAHGGLLLVLNRDPRRKRLEFLLGVDLRGALAEDINYLEASLVFGFGK